MLWSPGRILGLGESRRRARGTACGKPRRAFCRPSAPDFPIPTARLLSRAPPHSIAVRAHQGWRTAQVGEGVALRSRSLRHPAPAAPQRRRTPPVDRPSGWRLALRTSLAPDGVG